MIGSAGGTTIADATALTELLAHWVRQQPGQRVYTFLDDGEAAETHMTYADLDRRARAVAGQLQHLVAPGERALLLYPPGLDYIVGFFGCLYAGVIAVPAYPPNPVRMDRTLPRLQAMVANAEITVALTNADILAMAEYVFEDAPDLAALQWVATDTLAEYQAQCWSAPAVIRESLAFLQYTSGSTGVPKGVMLSHGNLLENVALIAQAFELSQNECGVFWLPPYHDMGLIGGLLGTIFVGATSILMSPMTFLQRPVRWLQAISRYQATISGGPNFAYDLCVRKTTPEQRATLDLSRWGLAFNGAEPVRAETMERFVEAFAPCGFRREAFTPCYGLAEATLFVTGVRKAEAPAYRTVQATALENNHVLSPNGEQPGVTLASCGVIRPEQQVVVADPETLASCPPDQVGEIWVQGHSVAQGYWGRSAETADSFQARLAATGEGPFLRTGDLGFIHNGELFITGRLKDLIIIDGRNHYPQDIEATIEQSHNAVRAGCVAAFSVTVGSEERLVAAAEVERGFLSALRKGATNTADSTKQAADIPTVLGSIRRAIAERHDIRVHAIVLLKTGYIPKTSSGKIQRHACRAGFIAGTL
ncbi:MAG: fatty acyl-AMP ligase, partial [Chloroflexales bacterium]|nr:fatty acyl-AMP ligase [Chloroflexales bacterium]